MVQLPCNPAEILNEHAREHDHEQIQFANMTARYPDVVFKETGTMSVTRSNHAELTLSLHALQRTPTNVSCEIGVSKGLCWLCQHYIHYLMTYSDIKILVSENQGKVHSGWSIPDHTPEAVSALIRGTINNEIREIQETILARKKSDSFPRDKQGSDFDNDEDLDFSD